MSKVLYVGIDVEDDKKRVMIRKEMEGAWKFIVPLRVDIGMGRNWAEAH